MGGQKKCTRSGIHRKAWTRKPHGKAVGWSHYAYPDPHHAAGHPYFGGSAMRHRMGLRRLRTGTGQYV
jgi:hypothetical protein